MPQSRRRRRARRRPVSCNLPPTDAAAHKFDCRHGRDSTCAKTDPFTAAELVIRGAFYQPESVGSPPYDVPERDRLIGSA